MYSVVAENVNPNVCNFDSDFCGWIQDYRVVLDPSVTDPYLQYADSYDFFRISGTTPSSNTGPNGDHTSGNGASRGQRNTKTTFI